jgi:RluA family pseudouridine synthase
MSIKTTDSFQSNIPFPPDLVRIEETFITKHWDWKLLELTTPVFLLDALQQKLPHITSESWPERLAWGGAFINGVEAIANRLLPIPCRIEYYEPKFDYTKAHSFFPAFDTDRICFEDEHLLVYVKPGGLPCVPAREQRYNNLRSYLDKYLGRPIHMPSRLDMSTYGLVPVSKHPLTHDALQQIFQRRQIEKRYILKTPHAPNWITCEVSQNITKHPGHPVLRCCSSQDGKQALTGFEVLNSDSTGSLILATPHTGRTHQIRVHAHSLGCSIIGDNFYQGVKHQTLHLACFQLIFNHPLSHERLTIEIPQKLRPLWMSLR